MSESGPPVSHYARAVLRDIAAALAEIEDDIERLGLDPAEAIPDDVKKALAMVEDAALLLNPYRSEAGW